VLRFRRAVELLRLADGATLAEVAAASGYYDQAHLNRDFRALAGGPPGALLPFVQDAGAAAA
jgi:transcriptional regulator GlxA family with amidase domain